MALQLIFSVEVPDLAGGYETHYVKWDDMSQSIRVFTGGTSGDLEVAGGNDLDYVPGPELYMVQESDGDTVDFRQVQQFPYAEQVITLDVTVTGTANPSAIGGTDGSISISIGGGDGVYQARLNGGTWVSVTGTAHTFTGLSAGSYSIEAIDASSNTGSAGATLTDPAAEPEPEPEPTPVYGCTDPTADNFDSLATEDNGSCTYSPKVFSEVKVVEVTGCTEGVCLRWFNSLGGIDTWVFSGKVDKPFSSEASGEFSYANGLKAATSKSGQPSMTLRTANLNFNRYQALWQLYTSPKVWIHHPDNTTEEVYVLPASVAAMPLGRSSYDLAVEISKAPINTLRR